MTKKDSLIPIDAHPVKSFFVEMLTRDIELQDSILDLIDNCIDGVSRVVGNNNNTYNGYFAKITFSEDVFEIEDNCGGIPIEVAGYAFKMGKPNEYKESNRKIVGTYGIGMKRAMFKIGKKCEVLTYTDKSNYRVDINPEWLLSEEWNLKGKYVDEKLKQYGTKITITHLNKNISSQFKNKDGFASTLKETIEKHYALIIQKGFSIYINGSAAIANPIKLLFSELDINDNKKELIRPFVYKTSINTNGSVVNVFLAIGFTMPPPTQEELDGDIKEKRWSSANAGWTIICNERIVLYADRTMLTGWGEAGVANYHTQFIAISGFVEFSSDDPRSLPMTTTKRGVDANSQVYQLVKDKMREGLKQFIAYTNRWKGRERESRKYLQEAQLSDIKEIKSKSNDLPYAPVARGAKGQQSMPKLPMPKAYSDSSKIAFKRKNTEIQILANYFFGDANDVTPAKVGERCFEYVLSEASK